MRPSSPELLDGLLRLGEPSEAADHPVAPTELLDRMLIFSGRPWSVQCPGLRGSESVRDGARTTVTGALGPLQVTARIGPAAPGDTDGAVSLELDWRNAAGSVITDCVVGLRLPGPPGARLTMPQVIYHDNPSAATDRTVPHVSGGGFVTREHRLPIPAVTAEWDQETYTLLSLPDPRRDDHGRTRYGGLGAVLDTDACTLLATSGVVCFDGAPDVDYVHKARIAGTEDGYLTLRPGERIDHHYQLIRGRQRPGHGFRELIRIGARLPADRPGPRLSRSEAIELKTAALDARWFADGPVAGYLKFPAWGEARGTGRYAEHGFLYGWTGQCLRLAWCDAVLGLRRGEPVRVARCRSAVEHFLTGSAAGRPGLRYNGYDHDNRRWHGFPRGGAEMISARAFGETLTDLADIIDCLHRAGLDVPGHWTAAVTDGADLIATTLLAEGVVPLGWRPDGAIADPMPTAGGAAAAQAVLKAYRIGGDERHLRLAEELAEGYQRLTGTAFERPYAHATLDAACEDKESGIYLFRLLVELAELTGDRRQVDRAAVVADWLLSWVYHWSPGFDSGTVLDRAGFTARGWPGVSVQNHHLDVFFPSSDLWRLGELTDDDHYRDWAMRIDTALRQGICRRPGEWGFDVVGEQAEAFFVTDWQQRGAANNWNPSWVIALPLWHALELEAAGVGDQVGRSHPVETAVDQPDVHDRRVG